MRVRPKKSIRPVILNVISLGVLAVTVAGIASPCARCGELPRPATLSAQRGAVMALAMEQGGREARMLQLQVLPEGYAVSFAHLELAQQVAASLRESPNELLEFNYRMSKHALDAIRELRQPVAEANPNLNYVEVGGRITRAWAAEKAILLEFERRAQDAALKRTATLGLAAGIAAGGVGAGAAFFGPSALSPAQASELAAKRVPSSAAESPEKDPGASASGAR